AVIVGDWPAVLGDQRERGMAGEVAAQRRELDRQPGVHEKRRAVHGAGGYHDNLCFELVLADWPGWWLAVRRRSDFGVDQMGRNLPDAAVRHHLNAPALSGGKLDPVGSLLCLVRAAHVAHPGAAAALYVDREFLHRVAGPLATGLEQQIVLVDVLVGQ